jgi:phosphate transport system protein
MPTTPEGFTKRTERLRADLVEQGRRVQAMVEASFEALFGRDEAKGKRVAAMDDAIDAADVALEKACVLLLCDATQEGSELGDHQLRTILTIVKVNNELERIADAGVDVCDLVSKISGGGPAFPGTFSVMANSVVGILRDVTTSVSRNDPALAKVVLQSQHTVTAFKSAILRDAEEQIAKGKMPVDFAFLLHEVASQCELIADHCTNIAEQIIYLTTGAVVKHLESAWVEQPGRG